MPPSISPSRTPLPRRRCKQKRERSPRFFKKLCKKRPVHPHGPFFVCRIDAGRGMVLGRTLSVSLCSTARSPFCRLAGEVAFGTNPLSRLRRQLSRRESPWQRGQVSSLFVNGRKKPAVKQQTFRPCQSLSLSGEVARRSRDGEGLLPGRTPSVISLCEMPPPPKVEALAKRASFVLTSQRLEEANL